MLDQTIKKIIINKKLNKFEKLSNILKYLFVDLSKINPKKYYILGSFAIREYRTISDLDINLDYNEFFKLSALVKLNLGHIEFYNNQIRWFFDLTKEYNELTKSNENDFSIEAFQKLDTIGFPNNNFSLKYLTKNKGLDTDNNNHQFFSLKTLLKWKKTMNRPKDQDDIKLIEKLLKKNNF